MSKSASNLSRDEFLWLWKDDGIPRDKKTDWARKYLARHHLAIGLDKAKLEAYLGGEASVKANAKMYLFIDRMKRAYAQYKRRTQAFPVSFSVNHKAALELERLSKLYQLPVSTIVEQIVYEKLNNLGEMVHEPLKYHIQRSSLNERAPEQTETPPSPDV